MVINISSNVKKIPVVAKETVYFPLIDPSE
jgi:hypothetical protein